ncbi:archease [Gimesia panareensis]|nr:archease [Gimesia panareensis]
MYSTFEHTADIGLDVRAESRETLFAEAASGLLSILVEDPETVRPEQEVTISVSGNDLEYLLFDWLDELLFRFETSQLLLCEYDVRFHAEGITVSARGETFQSDRHRLAHEVKAITYHQLTVQQTAKGWQARFIVDI